VDPDDRFVVGSKTELLAQRGFEGFELGGGEAGRRSNAASAQQPTEATPNNHNRASSPAGRSSIRRHAIANTSVAASSPSATVAHRRRQKLATSR
jgi:hypothetical protein